MLLRFLLAVMSLLVWGCSSTAFIQETASPETSERGLATAFSQTGGSVLAFLRVGAYATAPTNENWERDVRSAVTSYHLDPERIRQHLRDLKAAGQRRVGVILWFVEPLPDRESYLHAVVPRPDGTLPPQARANLLAFLHNIDAVGFDEVQIRFGPQGGAEWRCFKNPACYADPSLRVNPHLEEGIAYSWDVIRSTIDDVEAQGLQTPRLYDVAAEYPGHPFMAEVPGWNRYTSRLWELAFARYTPRGVAVNMSFNHAHVAGTEASFDLFDRVGWPEKISIDVYDNIYGSFGVLADALARRGRRGYPVFVQETFLDDEHTADALKRAATDFRVDLRYVMQWPVSRPLVSHATTEDMTPYAKYLGLRTRSVPTPQPNRGTLSATPSMCRVAPATGTCTVQLQWNTTGVRDAQIRIDGKPMASGTSGTAEVPWVTQTVLRFDLFGDGVFLGSTLVRGLPVGIDDGPTADATARSGTLRARPETCELSAQGLCTTRIAWTTQNVRAAEVRVGAQRFASGLSGEQDAPWVQEAPLTFELFGDGQRLASVTVRGRRPNTTPPPPVRRLRAEPPTCRVGPSGLCTTFISWDAPTPATVFVDGQPFAGGLQGRQEAPWIQLRPYTFTLVSDATGIELDRVIVEGVP
ncbi:MAG: hypothetical protein Q8S33_02340 [Myxococcales bacterium]|nr:hypothetical protein [Myxococcales bacterium]